MRSVIALITLAFAAMVNAAPISVEEDKSALKTYTHCNRPGVFALTFDDGPFEYSWDLAHTLNARGIKATFFTNGHNFVVGDFNTTTANTRDGPKTYAEVLQTYVELGHEVASHTYEHAVLVSRTTEYIENQMNKQSDVIFSATGKRVALMRPPQGETDPASEEVLHELGYSSVLWDIDPLDYTPNGLDAQMELVRGVVEQDIEGETEGHICLQHDVHRDSVNQLTPAIIDYISGKGYEFVTVSDCLGIDAYQQ